MKEDLDSGNIRRAIGRLARLLAAVLRRWNIDRLLSFLFGRDDSGFE